MAAPDGGRHGGARDDPRAAGVRTTRRLARTRARRLRRTRNRQAVLDLATAPLGGLGHGECPPRKLVGTWRRHALVAVRRLGRRHPATGLHRRRRDPLVLQPEHFSHSAGLVVLYDERNFAYLRLYRSESLESNAVGILVVEDGVKRELLLDRAAVDTDQVVMQARIDHGALRFCLGHLARGRAADRARARRHLHVRRGDARVHWHDGRRRLRRLVPQGPRRALRLVRPATRPRAVTEA